MEWSKLSIKEIADIVCRTEDSKIPDIIEELKNDNRSGVISIIKKLEKSIDYQRKENIRLMNLKKYEHYYIKKGAKYIAGIDEVGMGPLAGPVYAAAVVLPIECMIKGINDSKKLSAEKRSQLCGEIKDNAISYGIGYCDERTIDKINILNATYEAMKRAISKLTVRPDVLLIDAVRIPGIDIFQVPIIKGDSLSFSVAGASIVAKVQRDSVMDEYHKRYPVYNFLSNKGYGTKEHIEAIKDYGPCPIHRETFIKNIV